MRASRLVFLRTASLASVFLFAGAAAADGPGNDEVTLKNGGSLRGTVVASEPGVSVKVLVMGEKDVRVIPWAQVGDVEKDKFAPKAAAVQPGTAGAGYAQPIVVAPVPPPPPALGASGVVRLHVDSPEPVVLHTHSMAVGQVGAYGFVIDAARPVCASPCDKVIDGSTGEWFSVGGAGINESRNFTLLGRTGDVRVNVSPGSHGLRVGGYWLVVLGGSALIVGASMLALGATATNIQFDATGQETTSTGNSSETLIGGAVGGAGLAALVGGIVMLVESRTTVDIRSGGEPAPQSARTPRYWAGEF